MSIIHVTGTGGSVASDRTLFVGLRIPEDIKQMLKHVKQIDREIFRKLLHLAVSDLSGEDLTEDSTFKELSHNSVTEEVLSRIYSGLYILLQSALRLPHSSLKQENFKEDLQEMKIPKEFIPDLVSAVYGAKRPVLDENALKSRPRLPSLDNLRWRVDVAISTSSLNRVLEPSVTMEMTLSDGKIHSFEVPMTKFHELRYSVATVLKGMQELETKNILKIQD